LHSCLRHEHRVMREPPGSESPRGGVGLLRPMDFSAVRTTTFSCVGWAHLQLAAIRRAPCSIFTGDPVLTSTHAVLTTDGQSACAATY